MDYLEETEDVYIIGGALKLFFRELQEPLIPWDIVEQIHIKTEFGDEFEEVDIVKECLNEMQLWHKVGVIYVKQNYVWKVCFLFFTEDI